MARSTPNVVVIIQARTGSSRLPGKVLREVGGLSLIGHLLRRVGRAQTPTGVVVATTTDASDDRLVSHVDQLGVACVRGPLDDVLARFVLAAAAHAADVIVRVTGDCPLLDPAELDRVVGVYLAGDVDYVTNQAGSERCIPRGLDVEVFSRRALELAAREGTQPGEREHVTPYLYNVPGRFRTRISDPPGMALGHLRWTVDTPADLELVEAVVTALGLDATTAAIAAWLAEHPEIAALNANVVQRGIDAEMSLRRQRVAGRTLVGRADASPELGHGHVARLSALLDGWCELGGRAVLIGDGVQGSSLARLQTLGIPLLPASTEPLAWARQHGAVALAADGYQFTAEVHAGWRKLLPVLQLDDLASEAPVADLVVNQNLGFSAERYRKPAAWTKLLLGHPYVLLRRELRASVQKSEPRQMILVTFGGSDPRRSSVPAVRALLLAEAPAGVPLPLVCVVLGPGTREDDRATLQSLARDLASRLEVHVDVTDMLPLLRRATVALTAAGSTTWELMRVGVPMVLVMVAENQRCVGQGVAAHGAGEVAGGWEDLDWEQTAKQVQALLGDRARRERLARSGQALIDGRGVWRVIDALLSAIEERNISRDYDS